MKLKTLTVGDFCKWFEKKYKRKATFDDFFGIQGETNRREWKKEKGGMGND